MRYRKFFRKKGMELVDTIIVGELIQVTYKKQNG